MGDIFSDKKPANLGRYLPRFIQRDTTVADTLAVHNAEHDRLIERLATLEREFFVSTATGEGLAAWESILELPTNTGLTVQQRRNRILLLLQSHNTSTLEFLQRLVSRYFSATAAPVLSENNPEYTLQLDFDRVPTDWRGLLEALELYKPAHLGLHTTHTGTATTTLARGSWLQLVNNTTIGMSIAWTGAEPGKTLAWGAVVQFYSETDIQTKD